ncbi:hypothetical protein TWF694_010821 [Orbilia ellipsospora]|uniref:Uncharacterized protein n=1 Tax=Orbilia ellipsospora TaxID=2528407 RepID=A0AAV9X773_9PEZI
MSATRVLASRGRPAILKQTSIAVQNARHIHDITITRTGKPIYRQGGGRSSLGGNRSPPFRIIPSRQLTL